MDGRNYFRPAAVRAKTLVKGDVLVGSGLVILNVYTGSGHEVATVMQGSAMVVPTLAPDGKMQGEGLSDPSKIAIKMASGYVLVKASPTGKDDPDENVFFLAPGVSIVQVWQFAENS